MQWNVLLKIERQKFHMVETSAFFVVCQIYLRLCKLKLVEFKVLNKVAVSIIEINIEF